MSHSCRISSDFSTPLSVLPRLVLRRKNWHAPFRMCKKWMKEITFSAQLFALNQQEPPHLSTTEPSPQHGTGRWQHRAGSCSQGDAPEPPSLGLFPLTAVVHTGILVCSAPQRGCPEDDLRGPPGRNGGTMCCPWGALPWFCPLSIRGGCIEPNSDLLPLGWRYLLETPFFCWLQRSVLYLLCLAPRPDQRVSSSLSGSRS